MSNKTVAFIPARAGSKGIPGKNIKLIAGKPLIAWSIEQALDSSLIDAVYVSTDSEKIAEVATRFGAQVPFLRPPEISGDTATTESAMLHFCDYLENQGDRFDKFLLIQPTSPVRDAGRFDDAIRRFEVRGYDSMVAVAKSHRFFWYDTPKPTASYDYTCRPRRQDIKLTAQNFVETGSFYLTKTEQLKKFRNRLCGVIGIYKSPENEAYEIDTLLDFVVCEAVLDYQLKGAR